MVYVAGKNESIQTLKKLENFQGSDEEYKQKLLLANPSLAIPGDGIKLNTLILLTGDSPHSPELTRFVREINASREEESKEMLCLFQNSNLDVPTILATNEIMEEAQEYSHKYRDSINQAHVSDPWMHLSGKDAIDALIEAAVGGSGIAAGAIYRRRQIYALDQLYEAMLKRDVLNRDIYLLEKAAKNAVNRAKKADIQRQIGKLTREAKNQTAMIKELLPKKIQDKLTKYLTKQGVDIYKARNNSFSQKMAGKGGSTTLKLDFLNTAGLSKAKSMMQKLAKVGSLAEKGTLIVGPAFVAYDTYQAYQNKEEWGKVLLSGSAGLATGVGLGMMAPTASWGAVSIGLLAGDAAVGGLILASSPVWGTALCIVVGFATIGYATYKVSGYVEELWDTETGKHVRNETSNALEEAWKWFKSMWTSEPSKVIYEQYGLISIPRANPNYQPMA